MCSTAPGFPPPGLAALASCVCKPTGGTGDGGGGWRQGTGGGVGV